MNLSEMKAGSQGRCSNICRLYLVSSQFSSIRPWQKKRPTDTSTARRGSPRTLLMSLMAHCIKSSVNNRLPQTARRSPIGTSLTTEILHWGYLSMGLPHSNTEVIWHGQSFCSTITSPLTSGLTLTTSSATVSSLAQNLSRTLIPSLPPSTMNSHNYLKVWMVHLT